VIIFTGYGDWDTVEDCLVAGAFEYISKPIDLGALLAVVRRALLRNGLIFQEMIPLPVSQPIRQFPFIVGTSQPILEVLRAITKVADVDSNVCVYGESGTGKDLSRVPSTIPAVAQIVR
jgi:DNA-binding NtrC family response regulator